MHLRVAIVTPIFFLLGWAGNIEAQSSTSVLVLHGVWDVDNWEYRFDQELSSNLRVPNQPGFEISFQYLGVDSRNSQASFDPQNSRIQREIRANSVDLIVGVLPDAIDFAVASGIHSQYPFIAVLPGSEIEVDLLMSDQALILESLGSQLIRNTLIDIMELLPRVENIAVISGSNGTDRVYLEFLEELVPEYPNLNFDLLTGYTPEALTLRLSDLNESYAVLELPFESYRAEDNSLQPVTRSDSFLYQESSTRPIFSIYENTPLVVGGFISPPENYARIVAQAIRRFSMDDDSWRTINELTVGESVYKWEALERWNINIENLSRNYTVTGRPVPFSQSNPRLFWAILNIIFILAISVAALGFIYYRERGTNKFLREKQNELETSQRQYNLLATNMNDSIWSWDVTEDEINFCSPSITKLLGKNSRELIGQSANRILSEEAHKQVLGILQSAQDRSITTIANHRNVSGDDITCEITASPISGASGNEWVVVSRDITERLRENAEKEKLNELVSQNQKFDSLGNLASGIAHDFNNILGAIIGSIELLEINDDPDSKKGLIDKLKLATSKAGELVRQILQFSRQETAQDISSHNIIPLIDDSVSITRTGAPNSIAIEFRTEISDFYCNCNPSQIGQVFINLITNAWQAVKIENGHVIISTKVLHVSEPLLLQHGKLDTGDYLAVSVQDNGDGIDREMLDKIFEPFYTSKQTGTGIGLSVVRGIVTKHGGGISITSEKRIGTTLTVYLPKIRTR